MKDMKGRTEVGEKLRQLLWKKGMTPRYVSVNLMKRIHNHVYNIIFRKTKIDRKELNEVLEAIGCTVADLESGMTKIPIVGVIPAGNPILTEQEPVGHVDSIPSMKNLFALEVAGNSMFPAYRTGDVVILKPLNIKLGVKGDKPSGAGADIEALDGCDVAFLRNNESSLKRLKFQWRKGGDFDIEFVPVNTAEHDPIHIEATDTLCIQGIVVDRRSRCPV